MIDTVRIKIRINNDLRQLLFKDCTSDHSGSLAIPPFEYKINYFLDKYRFDLLYLEGSFPKLWYGENVHLLYENQIEAVLNIIFYSFLRRYGEFPHFAFWIVQRLDVVYAWKFDSEEKAQKVIEFAENLIYPRVSKHFYGDHESVTFGSKKSRTLTFYRKFPEFKNNGFSLLLNSSSFEVAQSISDLSNGVVRFEVMNRSDFLKSFLDTKMPITFDMIIDSCPTIELLNFNLKKFIGSVDLKLIHHQSIYKALVFRFKRSKALRLFCFFITYFSNIKFHKLIDKYRNSSDVANNIKDIKEAMVILPNYLASSKFDLIIPSPLVVNGPLSSAAVAEELDRRLKLIENSISYIEDEVQKEVPF